MLKQTVKRLVTGPARAYIRSLTEEDARSAVFRPDNERTVEYGFALRQLAVAYPRPTSVLDVGTGRTAWPHLLYSAGLQVTAIDNVEDYWPAGMINRHWPVENVDITRPDGFTRRFDAVTCLSVLEHIVEHEAAMRQMAARLNPGGLLIVTCPFAANEPYCEDVCRRPDTNRPPLHSYRCQSFSRENLQAWQQLGLQLVDSEFWSMFSGPVFRTGDLTRWRQVTIDEPHQLGCFAFRQLA